MKKAVNYAILGANIFFTLFFIFGLYVGIGEAIAEGHAFGHEFIGTACSGLFFFGGVIYFFPFIIPFALFFMLVSLAIKKDFSAKQRRINFAVLVSFIAFYILMTLVMIFIFP